MEFTSTARKDGRWWVVQNDQHPGALSQVARLDQAAAHQREAIAFVADLDEADVDVVVTPVLDEELTTAMDQARSNREDAERLQREASELMVKVARALVEGGGYSLRDAAAVLGVSHQRVAQLIGQQSERARSRSRRRYVPGVGAVEDSKDQAAAAKTKVSAG